MPPDKGTMWIYCELLGLKRSIVCNHQKRPG
jgi:hypothetical protein